MLPFDIVYVWIYYAGGRSAVVAVSGLLSPNRGHFGRRMQQRVVLLSNCFWKI